MIGMIGVDHRTANADVRGRIQFTRDHLPAALQLLVADPAITEAAILSTCNRTEVYVAATDWVAAAERVQHVLITAFVHGLDEPLAIPVVDRPRETTAVACVPSWQPCLHQHDHADAPLLVALMQALCIRIDLEAAGHLFRVASGLQSLVLGETQILGQIKDALAVAETARTIGPELRSLFTQGIQVGKRVHDMTAIGRADRSVAAYAITAAQRQLGDLAGKTALVIGAGRTSQLCTHLLHAAGVGQLILANRSPHAALELARTVGARVIALEELAHVLPNVALIVSATAAPHVVLRAASVAQAMLERSAPLLILDLAIPCDVEASVGDLPGVALYTLDTLYELTKSDMVEWAGQRQAELAQAEELVAAGVAACARERMIRSAGPSISALRQYIDRAEVEERMRALAKLDHLSAAERAIVERLGQRITGKMFHYLVSRIRSLAEDETLPPDMTLRVLKRLFADADAATCANRPAA